MPAILIMPANAFDQGHDHAVGESTQNPPPLISPKRLDGKVAIVTGGAKGIGEATARLFAQHGARVVIADIDDAAATTLAQSLPTAVYTHCDLSSEPDVEALILTTVARFGRLDILFNNAGVLGRQSRGTAKSVADLDAAEFERVMRVNVLGTALGMKHAARVMRRGGCIISTASVAGVMGGLGPHAYTASKHAVVGLTRNAACELGRQGIRVNCISPFGVATSMLMEAWRSSDEEESVEKVEELVRGMARLKGVTLKARDVAEVAVFLASDEAKYVSGHNLVVDGGYTSSKNCVAF